MATNRKLVTIKHLKNIEVLAKLDGFVKVETKSPFEELRMVKPRTPPLIVYRKVGKQHLTVFDNSLVYARKVITGLQNAKNERTNESANHG